jgi:hypothetical protein
VNYLVKVYPMRLPKNIMLRTVLTAYFFFAGLCYSHLEAQWQTQPIPLKAGWNPIYLHVDATHASISDLVGDLAIDEIWLWSPSVNEAQFVLSPDAPSGSKSRWIEWRNNLGDATSQLKSLIPNAAYLVRLSDGASDTTWSLKGKPVPPQYNWTTTGLNFVGFPVNPSANWNLESYFLKAGSFLSSAEFYNYVSGDLGRNNPAKVFGLRTTALPRGRAMWVDTGDAFNQYFGPFQLTLQNFKGFQFGTDVQSSRIRLQNMTNNELTVRLSTVSGEASPQGEALEKDLQSAIMIRTTLNQETQVYDFEACPCNNVEVVLQPKGSPGQEVEVVVGLNRSLLDGPASSISSAVFRLEDALSQARVDIPMRAEKGTFQGLWVGQALVDRVSRANLDTVEPTPKPFPLRFIMHQEEVSLAIPAVSAPGDGLTLTIPPSPKELFVGEVIQFSNGSTFTLTEATELNGTTVTGDLDGELGIPEGSSGAIARLRMLQRVHVGLMPGMVEGLATHENSLDPDSIDSARRISTIHLPFSEANEPWSMVGSISHGSTLTTTVLVDHGNQSANPFIHTYHPDHDNLNADFDETLPRGLESFGIERNMRFELSPSQDGFNQIVSSGNTVSGRYAETMTLKGESTEGLPNENQYSIEGVFEMIRISSIPSLTLP